MTKICTIHYEKPLPIHSVGSERLATDWYVGDTHVHSTCSKLRLSGPSNDNDDDREWCGCTHSNTGCGNIDEAGGPSFTQRTEEAREMNFDFIYVADHSNGSGGRIMCSDDADSAYNNVITDIAGSPCGDDILPCPNAIKCSCDRQEKYVEALERDVVVGKTDNVDDTHSQEIANKPYIIPSMTCGEQFRTSRLVANYRHNWIDNFEHDRLNLLNTVNSYDDSGCIT